MSEVKEFAIAFNLFGASICYGVPSIHSHLSPNKVLTKTLKLMKKSQK